MPDTPLEAEEYDTYGTEIDTEDEPEPTGASPASNPRPWILAGLVLLVVFAASIALGFSSLVG